MTDQTRDALQKLIDAVTEREGFIADDDSPLFKALSFAAAVLSSPEQLGQQAAAPGVEPGRRSNAEIAADLLEWGEQYSNSVTDAGAKILQEAARALAVAPPPVRQEKMIGRLPDGGIAPLTIPEMEEAIKHVSAYDDCQVGMLEYTKLWRLIIAARQYIWMAKQ